VWVARFHWQTADDLAEIVADVKAMGANAIFFQVRGEADAFYASRSEPWSARLTGTLGRDPGWDPLQVMLDRAHAAGLEVHAWINTYSAWRGESPPPHSQPEHVLNAHPDWVAVDSAGNPRPPGAEYVALSPGNPAVQQHILDVVVDVVSRYDVDGVHFDYVRYSGRDFSYDAVTKQRLASPTDNPRGLSRADWQREQVTELVRRAHATVKAIKPRVQVSAAVWGVYRNPWGWPIKNTGYDTYCQDSRGWLREGIVDFVVPMTYWQIGGMPDFVATVRDFLGATYGRGVYPGLGVFQKWATWDEVKAQIELARSQGAGGVVLFSYPEALRLKGQLAGVWSTPAATPWSASPSPTGATASATPSPTPGPVATTAPAPTQPAPDQTAPTAVPAQPTAAPVDAGVGDLARPAAEGGPAASSGWPIYGAAAGAVAVGVAGVLSRRRAAAWWRALSGSWRRGD